MTDFFFSNNPIYGTNDDDKLFGFRNSTRLNGRAGNDLVRYHGTSDTTLSGGSGNDSISGHLGDDVLVGGWGSDYLYGSEGADTFELHRGGAVNTMDLEEFTDERDVIKVFAGTDDQIKYANVINMQSNDFVDLSELNNPTITSSTIDGKLQLDIISDGRQTLLTFDGVEIVNTSEGAFTI